MSSGMHNDAKRMRRDILVGRELELLRQEIARQDRHAGLHNKWCACWRCIGRLQAYVINTRLGRETWEDEDVGIE
jgi:hypothetical protein